MRTTLKRGMGRAATLNGNGRAVLPPPVLEPMRRYRQPPPPPRTTARHARARLRLDPARDRSSSPPGIGGGLYLYGHETLSAIGAHSKGAIAASKDKNLQPIASPSEPATALIVGYDARKGADATSAQDSRSDTIMLVRADPTNNTLSLMSFPRDLQVPIYCKGSDVPRRDRPDQLRLGDAAASRGTLDTVAHLTGLPINYLITVNFHGFKLLVNKLHGVYIDRRPPLHQHGRRPGRLREDRPASRATRSSSASRRSTSSASGTPTPTSTGSRGSSSSSTR